MRARLATVNLLSHDPQRAKRFYTEVLGFVEEPSRSHAPGFAYLRGPGCDVTIALPSGGVAASPGSTELGFEVEDLGAARTRLAELGVREDHAEQMGWGHAVELRDPDGHRIILYTLHAHT